MFRINGIDWTIRFVDSQSALLQRSDGSQTVGMADWSTKTIYLSDDLHGEFLKKVITHEIVHCVIMSTGIVMNIYQEEELADFVATYGATVLRLTRILMERIQ